MRMRRIGSIKNELIHKSREAALAAVQVFNNPQITFKSEMFIVNMHIAWTYLLHAYLRDQKIEYRYIKSVSDSGRRRFDKTKHGADKHLNLKDCLNHNQSPVDVDTANNLKFLIGLRHEIEHRMTTRIDDALSARFQACCLNFNEYIKSLFGDDHGIDKHLSFSLQFSALSDEQVHKMKGYNDILPAHVSLFVEEYDGSLSEEEFNSPKFAYRVLFTQKTTNMPGQADKVIEFLSPDSEEAKSVNITYALNKEKEKNKLTPTKIVKMMNSEGYRIFKLQNHTVLWQKHDAKKPTKGYGVEIENRWFWYDNWLNIVRQHCSANKRKYGYEI